MSLDRSQNALEILDFIAENGPKTLYEIYREKGMRRSSINLAFKILSAQNLISLDVEESRKRDRNAKVYALTFKGFVVFLSRFDIKRPTPYLLHSSLEDTEEINKKLKKLKTEWHAYKNKLEKLKEAITRNGELLYYPLFEYCHSFEQLIPGIHESLTRIAEEALKQPPSKWYALSEKSFRTEKKKIEKSLKMAQQFSKGKWVVFQGDKETPFDPVAFEKKRLDRVNEQLKIVFRRGDEFLRESFFMYFLMWFRGLELKLANQDLYDYTKSLLDKEEIRFNSNKQVLEKWLAVFSTS